MYKFILLSQHTEREDIERGLRELLRLHKSYSITALGAGKEYERKWTQWEVLVDSGSYSASLDERIWWARNSDEIKVIDFHPMRDTSSNDDNFYDNPIVHFAMVLIMIAVIFLSCIGSSVVLNGALGIFEKEEHFNCETGIVVSETHYPWGGTRFHTEQISQIECQVRKDSE